MSKRELVRHLRANNCEFVRQGNHEIWRNRSGGQTSAVPRHTTIDRLLVRKICRELEIDVPKGD